MNHGSMHEMKAPNHFFPWYIRKSLLKSGMKTMCAWTHLLLHRKGKVSVLGRHDSSQQLAIDFF